MLIPIIRAACTAVKLNESLLRDGLQSLRDVFIPTAVKSETLKLLAAARKNNEGEIEVTSFVSPKAIPALADNAALAEFAQNDESLKNDRRFFSYLLLNEKGMEIALKQGVSRVSTVIAASQEFTKRNMNATIEEMEMRAKLILQTAAKNGVGARLFISTCFYDPFTQERISADKVADTIAKASEWGAKELVISDTTGHATPKQVKDLIRACESRGVNKQKLAAHFHDTFGTGVANSLAAFSEGIVSLDASTGGLGGCPFAPGASGNVAMEDLVWTLENEGVKSGIDLAATMAATSYIFSQCFPGKTPPSKVYRALSALSEEKRTEVLRKLQPEFHTNPSTAISSRSAENIDSKKSATCAL